MRDNYNEIERWRRRQRRMDIIREVGAWLWLFLGAIGLAVCIYALLLFVLTVGAPA